MTQRGRSRTRSVCTSVVLVACLLGPSLTPRAARADDLASAIELLEAGDLPAAVDALSAVVRRLSAQPARSKDLARAHLNLGIAYALVDPPQERAARASFREALKADATVTLPADRYPAKVVRLFNSARQDVGGAASEPSPRPVTPAAATPTRTGLRVALINMDTVAGSRKLSEHDQYQVRTALDAIARAAGSDLVVMSQVVLAVGAVSDLSPAVAARLAGGQAVPPPPAGPVAACMVDMNRMSTESALGKRYAHQITELQKGLQDDGSAKQSRLSAMDSTIAELRRDLEAQRAVLSPAAADRKSGEIEQKVRERDTFVASGQRELEQARQKAVSQAQAFNTEFQQQVRPHLERAARDRRCELLFSSQEAVALDQERDVTTAAIASLDAGALGASPAPARAPAAPTRIGVLDVQRLTRDSTQARAWRAEAERGSEKAATPEAETARQAALEAQVLAQLRPHVEEVARSKHVEMIVAASVVLVIDAGADVTDAVIARADAPAPRPSSQPLRVGGEIKEPRKLKDVRPVYPEIAKQARVQGVVILECEISPEGKVVDVKVLRGIPLLDEAAKEAVRQWVYTPTLLNGVPVPVIMTVTASFRLD